jgi:multidrug resistance efflux pump
MQAGHRADIDVMRGQLSRAEARLNQNELQLNQTKAKLNQTEAKLDESKVARRSVSRVLTRVALNHL